MALPISTSQAQPRKREQKLTLINESMISPGRAVNRPKTTGEVAARPILV